MMQGRTGSSCSSSATRPCICPVTPTPEIDVASTPARPITPRTLVQVASHLIDGDETLMRAIGRPRIHIEGETLYIEGYGRTPGEVDDLRQYADDVVVTWAAGFFFGGVQAVARTADGFDAGADVVRRGSACYVV